MVIVFFTGVVGLEVIHMNFLRTWNEAIFNWLMLVIGAVWGKN